MIEQNHVLDLVHGCQWRIGNWHIPPLLVLNIHLEAQLTWIIL